jgi:hypothetical protein
MIADYVAILKEGKFDTSDNPFAKMQALSPTRPQLPGYEKNSFIEKPSEKNTLENVDDKDKKSFAFQRLCADFGTSFPTLLPYAVVSPTSLLLVVPTRTHAGSNMLTEKQQMSAENSHKVRQVCFVQICPNGYRISSKVPRFAADILLQPDLMGAGRRAKEDIQKIKEKLSKKSRSILKRMRSAKTSSLVYCEDDTCSFTYHDYIRIEQAAFMGFDDKRTRAIRSTLENKEFRHEWLEFDWLGTEQHSSSNSYLAIQSFIDWFRQ